MLLIYRTHKDTDAVPLRRTTKSYHHAVCIILAFSLQTSRHHEIESNASLVLKLQAALEPNSSVDPGDVSGSVGMALHDCHVLVASLIRFERGTLLLGQAQDFGAQPIRVTDGHEGLSRHNMSAFTRKSSISLPIIRGLRVS